MSTPSSCSPALAKLPTFILTEEVKTPTGTHGKLSRAQAMAAWRKFDKLVRATGNIAYSKHLNNCMPEDLADNLCYLMVNGFFFTQAPFMEYLHQTFNIENEFIVSLPSINTIVRMLNGDTIDVNALVREIAYSKRVVRDHITIKVFIQIYHAIRAMNESDLNVAVMNYNRKFHSFIESNQTVAQARARVVGHTQRRDNLIDLFEHSDSSLPARPSVIGTDDKFRASRGSMVKIDPGAHLPSAPSAAPLTPMPFGAGGSAPPALPSSTAGDGGAVPRGPGPVPPFPPPSTPGFGHVPNPDSASKDELNALRGELQSALESVNDFRRATTTELIRLQREQLSSPQVPPSGASPDALEAMKAACTSQANVIEHLSKGSIDNRISSYPTAAPAESWMGESEVIGLQDASLPSLTRAWASRPSPDLSSAQEKEALRQLGSRYPAEGLLKSLPAPGKVELYRECRCVWIEGVYIFKHIVCTVADKDGHTLGSLQTCALDQAREDSLNAHRWKSLAQAVSVGDFIKKVDSLYMAPSDNAVEQEWDRAVKNDPGPLDLLHRLRPVLTANPKRAKMLILKHLANFGPDAFSAASAIQAANTADQWETILASFEDMLSYAKEAAREKGGKLAAGAKPLKDQGINMYERLDGSAPRGDGTDIPRTWGSFDTQVDLSPNEIKVLTNALHALRASQGVGSSATGDFPPSSLQAVINELRRQVPDAGSSNVAAGGSGPAGARSLPNNGVGSSGVSGDAQRLAALEKEVADKARLAALEQQLAAYNKSATFKPIFDLAKVYPLLGFTGDDVPTAKPGAAAGGGKCKVCVFLGFTDFVNYNEVNFKDMKPNQRYDHNPWKCPMVPEAIKKKAAADSSITPDQVRDALVPLPVPPWK